MLSTRDIAAVNKIVKCWRQASINELDNCFIIMVARLTKEKYKMLWVIMIGELYLNWRICEGFLGEIIFELNYSGWLRINQSKQGREMIGRRMMNKQSRERVYCWEQFDIKKLIYVLKQKPDLVDWKEVGSCGATWDFFFFFFLIR